MNYLTSNGCAICGEEQPGGQIRFLLAENRWEDKLAILHWDEQLASREGIQVSCSVGHVEELVIHWMTTGSLDYPFARTALGSGSWRRRVGPDSRVDLSGARQIVELAVHRESVERVLTESPQSLQAMLDALQEALLLETGGRGDGIQVQEEGREEEVCVVSFKP
jgi:hypothetical protein